MKPVFLHAGVRSGSSYLWSKFRELRDVMAFYEPFSEDLGRMPRQFFLTHGPQTWRSGHQTTAPYYLEYAPLARDEGVGIEGFRAPFSYENYFRAEDDLPEQRRYLQMLLDMAHHEEKAPVLGFSRSLGRLPWLSRHFPGAVHVVLVRNPVEQWLSGYEFYRSTQNTYFLVHPILCLQQPGDNAYMTDLNVRMSTSLQENQFSPAALYEVFLHVYGASTMEAVAYADLVVDIDLLSASPSYRAFAMERIRELTGLPVDLSDARVGSHPEARAVVDFAAIHREVTGQLADAIPALHVPRSSRFELHPRSILAKIETSLA